MSDLTLEAAYGNPLLGARRALAAVLAASLIAMSLLFASAGYTAAGLVPPDHPLVVDDDGLAEPGNCEALSTASPSIQAAIDAASDGDTITVCPGNYPEQVQVDESVTLLGAQANVDATARTFGTAGESNVAGSFTVTAPDVEINGFAVSVGSTSAIGIVIKTAGSGSLVLFNVVEDIGPLIPAVDASPVGPRDNTVGVYLELGPDTVNVVRNKISRMLSTNGSAQGILVGDSSSGDPSENVFISQNIIQDNASILRGAYGIQINNGASTTIPTADGFTTGAVVGNTIDGLVGNWAHGIGLEGPTPGMVVLRNDISNLLDHTPTPINAAIAVHLEANPDYASVTINQNNFHQATTQWGIVVNPSSVAANPGGVTDGTCNWWNSAEGPGGAFGNPDSTGAWVSDNVDWEPWLTSPAPVGDCEGTTDDDEECDEDEDGRDDDDCEEEDDDDDEDEDGDTDTDDDSPSGESRSASGSGSGSHSVN